MKWSSPCKVDVLLIRKELGVTFLGGGAHVSKKGGYYLLLRKWDSFSRKWLGHLIKGKITSMRRWPHPWTSFGWCISTLITRVKDLHPWLLRTLKDPLYIKLYFLSPLLFFFSLSIRLPEGRVEEVKAQGEHFLMLNLVVEKKSSEDSNRCRLNITLPRMSITKRFVGQSGLGSCLCSSP